MAAQKEKPKYSIWDNVCWMISIAWKEKKRVLLACGFVILTALSLNLTELFIAPQILKKVESGAEVSSLLLVIALFAGLLFLLRGLSTYLRVFGMLDKIYVRTTIIGQISRKARLTSYPNTLDARAIKMRDKAAEATSHNQTASEKIWQTLSSLLTNLLGFGIYLFLLSHLNPFLMLVTFITTLLSFFVSRKTDAWSFRHREEEADYDRKLSYIRAKSESLELAKDIRILGLAPWLKDLYAGVLKMCESFVTKSETYKLMGNLADVLLGILRNGIAYYYLINMALREGLPASTFLLYFTAVSGWTAWITGIFNEFAALHQQSLDLNTIREYLDLPEPFRFEGGEPLPDLSAGCEIRLEKVSFRYPDTEKDTIHEMDLVIRPGEKLALVGLNGAGKTTLVKLICGLLDPSEGRVLLNGRDIRDFNRQEYYEIFSTVFQDYSVLDVSVAENVASCIEGIDRQRVQHCLELAGLSEKVAQLPGGLDQKLGRKVWEEGVELSGGQTQRLLLARALYRDAPLLLLDEPTAALDPLAENEIYMKYHAMTKGKTSLYVSHRLASTRFCDRILLIEDGRVAEEGTHEELWQKGGRYAELYEVQSRYYQEGREF